MKPAEAALCARRADVDRNRGLGRNHLRDNLASGVDEAARSAQREDEERCPGAVCLIHGVAHELGGRGMNHAVDFGRVYTSSLGRSGHRCRARDEAKHCPQGAETERRRTRCVCASSRLSWKIQAFQPIITMVCGIR